MFFVIFFSIFQIFSSAELSRAVNDRVQAAPRAPAGHHAQGAGARHAGAAQGRAEPQVQPPLRVLHEQRKIRLLGDPPQAQLR